MATKAKRHIHKYHAVRMNSVWVWACALDDCNHYMPAHMRNMVPGKRSLCWGCLKEIILDENNMESTKPLCKECDKKDPYIEHTVEQARIELTEPSAPVELKDMPKCTKCRKNPSYPGKDGLCVPCSYGVTM